MSSSSSAGGRPTSGSAARDAAARVLVRVWQDVAYAAPTLDAELAGSALGTRDARLATELVYGVLRTRRLLERRIDAHATRRGYKRKPAVLAPLLMGAYSLLFLDRVPTHAAVDEAVRAVRAASDKRVAAFANAVLRKLATERQAGDRAALRNAAVEAAPSWLRRALRRSIGQEATEALLGADPSVVAQGLCLEVGRDRQAWIARLCAAAPQGLFEAGRISPRCIRARGAGDLRRLPGAGTQWIPQEEGAQLVALALGARGGETVLDACAGRGGKSFVLTAAVGIDGSVDVADRSPAKLERLRAASPHGARVRATYAVDWSRGPGQVPMGYDRALVDAPCSGVGTLLRRPEIIHRLQSSDVARLAQLQAAIVRGVAARVRDGGRLVYAVCSVLGAETDQVVERLAQPPASGGSPVRLEPCAFDAAPVTELAPGASSLRLLPTEHGTDGYFIASFRVRCS